MIARSNCSLRALSLGGLLCAAVLAGGVRAEELPRSPACRTALASLDDAEQAIAAARAASSHLSEQQQSVAVRLQPLRNRVADACLGGLTTSPSPSQRTWVAPTRPVSPSATAPRVQPVTPPINVPMPRIEAPVTVNNCNAATCVASDGSTLTRVGPNLVGPRGACRVEGVFLRCP